MKTLYKIDTKKKLRFIRMYVQSNVLIQESGVYDSKKFTTNKRVCHPKNVGKVNATSGEEQAIKELDSKYKNKLTQGYFKTINEAKNNIVVLPMLAKDYNKEKKKIDWDNPVFVQPKLDGMRCLAFCDGSGNTKLMSRTGKNIMLTCNNSMQHIIDELSKITIECILDGELYSHGKTFQENMHAIKSVNDNNIDIKYCIYDQLGTEIRDTSWWCWRSDFEFIKKCAFKYINIVDGLQILNEANLKENHKLFLSEGYEGSIIRHGNNAYKLNGRSSNLLKYKDFKDIACKIIDVIPSERTPTHGTPVCTWNGHTFKAGCKLSHTEREDLLSNKSNYIGKMAEIRYFEETDDGKPRFPVFYGIRMDK